MKIGLFFNLYNKVGYGRGDLVGYGKVWYHEIWSIIVGYGRVDMVSYIRVVGYGKGDMVGYGRV